MTNQEVYRGDIIDAHIHFRPDNDYFNKIAEASGYENTLTALETAFAENNITHAILMNEIDTGHNTNLSPNLRYCLGVNEDSLKFETIMAPGIQTSR